MLIYIDLMQTSNLKENASSVFVYHHQIVNEKFLFKISFMFGMAQGHEWVAVQIDWSHEG